MANPICSVPECTTDMTGKYLRNGYCERHNYSWKKYGTPLPTKEQRRQARKDRVGASRRQFLRTCEICDASFEAGTSTAKYCSQVCRGFGNPAKIRFCADCNKRMLAGPGSLPQGEAVCLECRRAAAPGLTDCPICGDRFEPIRSRRSWTRSCSKPCAMRLAIREGTHNLQDGKQVGRDPEKRRACLEKSTRKRRALKAGVLSEPYTRDEIAERDNYICWLCDKPVDMSLEWPDPESPSVDHVVPLSLGGSDLKSNVKLAHLGENVTRGNRINWKAGESNGREEAVAAGKSGGRFRDGSTAVLF